MNKQKLVEVLFFTSLASIFDWTVGRIVTGSQHWAEGVETLFKEMQQAIDLKDMGLLQSLYVQAKEKEEQGEKAKACNDHAPYV